MATLTVERLADSQVRSSMDVLLGGLADDDIQMLLEDLNNTLDKNIEVSRAIEVFEKPSKHAPLPLPMRFPTLRPVRISSAPEAAPPRSHSGAPQSRTARTAPPPKIALPRSATEPPQPTMPSSIIAPPQFSLTTPTTPQFAEIPRPTTATPSSDYSRSPSYRRISRPISALDLRALSAAYLYDVEPAPSSRASTPSLEMDGASDEEDSYLASAVFGRRRAAPMAMGNIMDALHA